jgi:hypothetical protein
VYFSILSSLTSYSSLLFIKSTLIPTGPYTTHTQNYCCEILVSEYFYTTCLSSFYSQNSVHHPLLIPLSFQIPASTHIIPLIPVTIYTDLRNTWKLHGGADRSRCWTFRETRVLLNTRLIFFLRRLNVYVLFSAVNSTLNDTPMLGCGDLNPPGRQ